MAVARTERGRSIEQRLRFNFPPMPKQIEALGEIRLREAGIELQGLIESCERFVVPMRQAQSSSEYAVAKAIEVVELDGAARLT